MIEMPIGWLSPTGEMIKCNTYEHITVAFRLVDRYVFNYTGFNPDEVLIENQWIHITRGLMLDHDYHVYYNVSKGPTIEQIHFLKPYFENKDCPLDDLEREMFLERIEML